MGGAARLWCRRHDHTSVPLELLAAALVAGALAVAWPVPDVRWRLVGVALAYLQIGMLLLRAAARKRPIPLPPEDTEEYLRLSEDALRMRMRHFDAIRCLLTFMLEVSAAIAVLPERWEESIEVAFVVASVAAGAVTVVPEERRSRAILARVEALQGPLVLRRGLGDPENLGLGGLVY